MRKKLWKRVVVVSLCSALLLGAVPSQRGTVLAEESTEATEEPQATEEPEATEQPVTQKSQSISLKVSKKTYTADQFGFSKETFKIGASAKTALSFKVTSGSKYVSVNQKGQVTIKRWTPQGTYKISVTAEATEEYKEAAKTVTIQVKAGKAMSRAGVKWDLKKNKTVKYDQVYGIGSSERGAFRNALSKTGYLKLKSYKKVKSGKNYKVTYTILWTLPTKNQFSNRITDEGSPEINLICDWMYEGAGGVQYCTLADAQTGEYLEGKNHYGVKSKQIGKWKYSGTQKIYGKNGAWFEQAKTVEATFSVTYPKSYKNLCILAGSNIPGDSQIKKFGKGKCGFEESGLCGIAKSQCHGIRVK